MARRDFRLDNLRCLLIFLVVFCHVMVEVSRGRLTGVLYQVIYVFHMPAFVFVTGHFARFRPKRILWGLAVPYAFFQVVATLYRNAISGRVLTHGLTLLDPQWTLWYLLACVLWYLTVPLLERATTARSQAGVVVGSLVVSVLVGFVPWVGEFLDLSRAIVLYPFFCAGLYVGRAGLSACVSSHPSRRRTLVLFGLVVALMGIHFWHGQCPARLLFRDLPYNNLWDFEVRVIIQLAAAAWCAWLFVAAPARDLGFVSEVGRNTMSVYLLHTWLIRLLRLALPLPGPELAHLAECAIIAAGMLVVLGNDRVGTAFRFVFAGGWQRSPKKA